ncbi:hypothetical protein BASA62_001775 [Batrachochytrium salamandrivorans]|nr:hypothetical protein BASA62_001775 [Batrachochytrium salamandrivorans]
MTETATHATLSIPSSHASSITTSALLSSASTLCDLTQIGVSDIHTLILLLSSPEPSVCTTAIDGLTKYADSAILHRTQLLNLGIVKPLIDLTRSKDTAVKRASVTCLAAITEQNETHQDMRRRELVYVLIDALSNDDSVEVQDEAAFALANLAKDFSNKADIRKAGGIKALVKLLSSHDPDVKKNVAMALSMLLDDFTNRTEIRYVNGIGPLLSLLTSKFAEVQENALQSLILCAEDSINRTEMRKLHGIRSLVELISDHHSSEIIILALKCLANCLEEAEAESAFMDAVGIAPLVKLIQQDEYKIKHYAFIALSKAVKSDRSQNAAREAGILPIVATHLLSNDCTILSSSAMAIAALALNEMNQVEFIKLGVTESIIKLLSHDDTATKREAVAALASLFHNSKIRTKVRNTDVVQTIIKIVSLEDPKTIVNASECISMLAEEYANRIDIIKQNGIHAMLSALETSDVKIQASLCLSIARCVQETDGRIVLSKLPENKGLSKIAELLSSKDMHVCRNAAYALSCAIVYGPNASLACDTGALQQLISLSKEKTKSSVKFATDAMENLLSHHLSAKYWLRNHLLPENMITDPFYDIGYAGTNLDTITRFPTLAELQLRPVDKRREVILVDTLQDANLLAIIQYLRESILGKRTSHQIRIISHVVSKVMGGEIDNSARLSESGHRFRITALKLKGNSNVIPIGSIDIGIFYHRALLFKTLCDRLNVCACALWRGEYDRAWNVVDLNRQMIVNAVDQPASIAPVAMVPPTTPPSAAPVHTTPRPTATASKDKVASLKQRQAAAESTGVTGVQSSTNAPVMVPVSTAVASVPVITASAMPVSPLPTVNTVPSILSPQLNMEGLLSSMVLPEDDGITQSKEPLIVDLMYNPGRFMKLDSPESLEYQHIS